MLRKILDNLLLFGKKNPKFGPLFSGIDSFFYEVSASTKKGPHIRDSIDIKRWMIIVVIALIPCSLMAIWNSGLQQVVYNSSDITLVKDYLNASSGFSSYWHFIFKDFLYLQILKEGMFIFLPLLLISYTVGGLWEVFFATVRKHEINEGLLVTGLLFPLTLPPSIPYWMAALGISFGIVIGKEIFGGTGMNILNPALCSRAFLYFAFPAYMTGSIWAGSSPNIIEKNISTINHQLPIADAISQETIITRFNISHEIKKIHVDTIAAASLKVPISTSTLIDQRLNRFMENSPGVNKLTLAEVQNFLTGPASSGGLALSSDNYEAAKQFVNVKYGLGLNSDRNLFFGNKLGSLGEVSILACLIGAFILLITKIASWRTMIAFALGAIITATLLKLLSLDPFNPAIFDFPIYKHFLMGSLAFGLVFMATDPVSSPTMNKAKWAYGLLIGAMTIIIRTLNPAYPEGVMLAILFGNVFSPLFDYYAVRFYRRKKNVLS